jgi:CelD/BcsL family acetyltransferase involved in cellulose biosynthesis
MRAAPQQAAATGAGQTISIDPLVDPRWDAFLDETAGARLCHSSAWLEVLQRTWGYQPMHLAYETERGIEAVLPLLGVHSRVTGRRLVSLPFSGPAGPVGRSPEAVERLIESAIGLTSAGRYSYLNIQSTSEQLGADRGRFTTLAPFVCSVVPLPGDAAELWRSIQVRSLKKAIRQARRRGVVVRVSDDPADLRIFNRLYLQTSRKHGIPPPPLALFDNMWRVMQPRGMLFLLLASVGERVIGAQICFGYKNVLSAAYVGIDYQALRTYHQVKMLDWAAIELACARGYSQYDLLQSPERNEGLRRYKRVFGATESPMHYHYYPKVGSTALLRDVMVGRRWGVGKLARAGVRRLPDAGLRALGSVLFKHLG